MESDDVLACSFTSTDAPRFPAQRSPTSKTRASSPRQRVPSCTVAAAGDELATKSDLAAVRAEIMAELALQRSALTVRIVGAQVATATLLFAALRFLGA